MHHDLTDVPGLKVGHWTNLDAATGCTVILCPQGAVAGVDVRGSAPATRETDLLDPVCAVEKVHAIVLSGGSAYGLSAADGVMRWLEERGCGFDVGVAKVPIVPTACIFDLTIGRADVRPDAAAGYMACEAATAGPVLLGNVGVGAGATVGKGLGFKQATKGGLGSASKPMAGGIVIAALVAVNAFGDVYEPKTHQIIAGARKPIVGGFVDWTAYSESALGQSITRLIHTSTTLAVVATNAALTKIGATKAAQMAHDGLARAIRPVHTNLDGDAVFALSTGEKQADVNLIGTLAADVLAEAVVNAVQAAESLHDLPAARDLKP
jgi:L-aminopeptidase/D-esterase-like protein